MKNSHLILWFTLLYASCKAEPVPVEASTNGDNNKFLLAAVNHAEEVPQHGVEVHPQDFTTDDAQHIFKQKKIVAIPISKVHPDTQVLVDQSSGKAVVATHTDNSQEDMITAENIVFRPIFAYRKTQAKRRRVYQQQPSIQAPNYYDDNRRVYVPVYKPYPVYYPVYYKNYEHHQFPALA